MRDLAVFIHGCLHGLVDDIQHFIGPSLTRWTFELINKQKMAFWTDSTRLREVASHDEGLDFAVIEAPQRLLQSRSGQPPFFQFRD